MEDEQRVIWRKPSRSGTDQGGGNCVEVAALPGRVMVRDSVDPEGPHLSVSVADWETFVAGLRRQRRVA